MDFNLDFVNPEEEEEVNQPQSGEKSFFIILLEGHQTYSVYLATIWSQDYLDLEAQ